MNELKPLVSSLDPVADPYMIEVANYQP